MAWVPSFLIYVNLNAFRSSESARSVAQNILETHLSYVLISKNDVIWLACAYIYALKIDDLYWNLSLVVAFNISSVNTRLLGYCHKINLYR